jgi:hypothetical protein
VNDERSRTSKPSYCSWSGGKDPALALHEALALGAEPRPCETPVSGPHPDKLGDNVPLPRRWPQERDSPGKTGL